MTLRLPPRNALSVDPRPPPLGPPTAAVSEVRRHRPPIKVPHSPGTGHNSGSPPALAPASRQLPSQDITTRTPVSAQQHRSVCRYRAQAQWVVGLRLFARMVAEPTNADLDRSPESPFGTRRPSNCCRRSTTSKIGQGPWKAERSAEDRHSLFPQSKRSCDRRCLWCDENATGPCDRHKGKFPATVMYGAEAVSPAAGGGSKRPGEPRRSALVNDRDKWACHYPVAGR